MHGRWSDVHSTEISSLKYCNLAHQSCMHNNILECGQQVKTSKLSLRIILSLIHIVSTMGRWAKYLTLAEKATATQLYKCTYTQSEQ